MLSSRRTVIALTIALLCFSATFADAHGGRRGRFPRRRPNNAAYRSHLLNENPDKANWMGNLVREHKSLEHLRVAEFSLPSADNSDYTADSLKPIDTMNHDPVAVAFTVIKDVFSALFLESFQPALEKTFLDLQTSQRSNFTLLLENGIRGFATRLTLSLEGELVDFHAFEADKSATEIEQIAKFLHDHPTEFLIMDVDVTAPLFNYTGPMDTGNITRWLSDTKNIMKNYGLESNCSNVLNMTYHQLVNENPQCRFIILIEEPSVAAFAADEGVITISDIQRTGRYADTNDPEVLVEYFYESFRNASIAKQQQQGNVVTQSWITLTPPDPSESLSGLLQMLGCFLENLLSTRPELAEMIQSFLQNDSVMSLLAGSVALEMDRLGFTSLSEALLADIASGADSDLRNLLNRVAEGTGQEESMCTLFDYALAAKKAFMKYLLGYKLRPFDATPRIQDMGEVTMLFLRYAEDSLLSSTHFLQPLTLTDLSIALTAMKA